MSSIHKGELVDVEGGPIVKRNEILLGLIVRDSEIVDGECLGGE